MESEFARDFPHLFSEVNWGTVQAKFGFYIPPAHLVGNVSLVPFMGDQCLIIRLQDGSWEVPGGTLEPDESYLDAIRRELLEETGAELIGLNLLGAWHCRSSAAKPYRPHLPHPDFYRLACYGEVVVVSEPSNPTGAEEVSLVKPVSVEEASQHFASIGRHDPGDFYQLAARFRADKMQYS